MSCWDAYLFNLILFYLIYLFFLKEREKWLCQKDLGSLLKTPSSSTSTTIYHAIFQWFSSRFCSVSQSSSLSFLLTLNWKPRRRGHDPLSRPPLAKVPGYIHRHIHTYTRKYIPYPYMRIWIGVRIYLLPIKRTCGRPHSRGCCFGSHYNSPFFYTFFPSPHSLFFLSSFSLFLFFIITYLYISFYYIFARRIIPSRRTTDPTARGEV